jgi:hypothetical protein
LIGGGKEALVHHLEPVFTLAPGVGAPRFINLVVALAPAVRRRGLLLVGRIGAGHLVKDGSQTVHRKRMSDVFYAGVDRTTLHHANIGLCTEAFADAETDYLVAQSQSITW